MKLEAFAKTKILEIFSDRQQRQDEKVYRRFGTGSYSLKRRKTFIYRFGSLPEII